MGKDATYANLGRAEKSTFRQAWAEAKYNEILKEKSFTQEYKHVDMSHGTYRSVWWVLKEEGYPMNPQAEANTIAYVKKCHTMGAPWVTYDTMWERVDVLVMENGFKETFSKAWALKTSSVTNSADTAASSSSVAPPATAASANSGPAILASPSPGAPATASKRTKGGGKGLSKVPPAIESSGLIPSPRDKTGKEETSLQRAVKTKGIFTLTMATATNVYRNIESNPEWEWAKKCSLVHDAKSCTAEIERLLLANQPANDFFVWKLSDIKRRPGFDLDGCTTNIPGIFDTALSKLSKHCEKLLNMHKGTLA